MHAGIGRIFRKTFKIIAWVIGSVILLLITVALLIQIPAIQSKLTQKAVAFLEEKIGTEVSLEGISISFPKDIVLEGIYLEDQEGDTLLYAGRLAINTDLWGLARNEIQLNDVALENTVAFIKRAANDSAYNFTYILDAFAGDSTAVPDTLEQKGWDFSLQELTLDNIRLQYDDRLMGNHADVSLGEFALEMDEFDLENNRYGVEEILLRNTRANFEQTKLPAPDETSEDSAAALILSLERLRLENVDLRYKQSPLGQTLNILAGELDVEPEKIDLENQNISLNTLSLTGSSFAYHQEEPDTVLTDAEEELKGADPSDTEDTWQFSLNRLELSGNSVQYFDLTKPHQKGSVDFDHLWLTEMEMDARNIRYEDDGIAADVRNLSFREQSGFAVNSFEGKIDVEETETRLRDFLLETGNSRLELQASATYPSLKDIGNAWPQAAVRMDINESYISTRDIQYLQPGVLDSLPLPLPARTNLRIHATAAGTVNDLTIDHLVFAMLSETTLRMSGTVAGLPDMNQLWMNLTLDKFYTTRTDLERILPDTLLPDSMRLPAWVNLEAGYKGSLEKSVFQTHLTSDVGAIDVKGNMNLDSASALRGVNATLTVADLNVGDVLGKPDSVMGTLAMHMEVKTNGLSPQEMNGTLTARIDHFDFQGYRYEDFALNASIRDEILSADAAIKDENLHFTLDADYDFNGEVPLYDLTLDVKNADFEALNLSSSPIRGRGILRVNLATSDFKVLNGSVGIRKVAVFDGDELYAIDSLLFASIDQEGRSEINIDSDVLSANFEGSINIFSLPDVVTQYFNTYYSLDDSLEIKKAGRQHFTFDIVLKNTDILTGLLVPELTTFDPGKITGEFDSEAKTLDLRIEIDALQYANIGLDSFVFSTNSGASELNYNFMIDEIMVDSMRIDGLEFNGTVANDSIRTDLIILDSAERHKYVLAGTFFSRENAFELRLLPGAITLNYQPWSVPETNFMRFGENKFIARDVVLTNLREKIIIESKEPPGSPVFIGFRELNLEYLSSMVAKERPLSGLLEGDIHLYPDSTALTFTSDITIADFRIEDIAWGDVSLQVEQEIRNRFDVRFGLSGHGNDVRAEGFYSGGDSASLNLTAGIRRFNLASLQPLVSSQLENLSGIVTGEIRAKGTFERPDIDGSVAFRDTKFFSNYLSTNFSIDDERISFIDEGISFDNFEIADQNKDKARLDGTILTRNYRDFSFDLELFTDRFRLFNTEEGENELFYGLIEIEANATIRGDLTTPVVNGEVGLTDGSDLTYVVPQSEAAILETEGIVKFVDRTFEGDPFMRRAEVEASDTIKSVFRGLDLTARIELSDQETFTIIIDPVTKDQLTVKGNATLTLKIDPSGDMRLLGRYEISEGTYNLSFYKFVKREFDIESGSSITWSGDPLNAQMDIRAIYRVETSPMELFSNQLTGADPSEVNRYRQRLPFLVYLNITGQLLEPEIAFELEMPIDERNVFGGNVYARIQDINTRESDLNKQVFALLILKRFIADNPFENQAGGGLESTARRSVSKILSEQLNRLSENIKGVELSFDIKSYEDYSTGQAEGRTELQLGFSKSLMNDRLVVKLAGNIDIEGQDTNRDATDFIGDLALEYKITPDGRFRITGFRNSNYDMIDGELTETGVGLIYVKDYNSLSELFDANAETRN